MTRLLVIDNYDSFTYNLVQMFMPYDLSIRVYRCDKVSLTKARKLNPDYILISPGPKDPAHAGISMPLIREFYREVPILGVCLGMQCINEVFGGRTVRAALPMHGKTSLIFHEAQGLFRGLPSPFHAARYHSLVVRPAPHPSNGPFQVTAHTRDEVIMGLSHRQYPLHGVQFHPESFLTQYGFELVENFLRMGSLAAHLQPPGRCCMPLSEGPLASTASPLRAVTP